MASFFGEIRTLSSRAVDDEEADDQAKYEVTYEESDKTYPRHVKLMIISVSEIASIFVKSHFLNDNAIPICTINYTCLKNTDESMLYTGLLSNKNVKNVAVSISASYPDAMVCEVSKSVPEEICHEICEIIFNYFTPSRVLILTSKHMATFKSENSLLSFQAPFLKSLCSTQYFTSHLCNIPHLNSPNFLSNIPASILLKCEVKKLPALCIVGYVDTDAIDSLNVQVFDEILNEALLSDTSVTPNAKSRVVKYVKTTQSVKNNLYI